MNKYLLSVATLMLMSAQYALAQSKIKDGTVSGTSVLPDSNAVLDLESNTKGLLVPRVTLTATNNPSPLTAHKAGMLIYNTATAGTGATAVSPSFYYNDGTQWVKMGYIEPWNNVATQQPASRNSDSIYIAGRVGVGGAAATAYMDIQPPGKAISGLRIRNTSSTFGQENAAINYDVNYGALHIDKNGYVFRKYNPMTEHSGSLQFDTIFVADPTPKDLVAISRASIVRFEIMSPFSFGVNGVGAMIYADITYSRDMGFVVTSQGRAAAGSSFNPPTTVISGPNNSILELRFTNGIGLKFDASSLVSSPTAETGAIKYATIMPDGTTPSVAPHTRAVEFRVFNSVRSRYD